MGWKDGREVWRMGETEGYLINFVFSYSSSLFFLGHNFDLIILYSGYISYL